MHLRIQRTPLATRQIREEARWWRRNRTRAPGLFQHELGTALKLIAEYPDSGSPAEEIELSGVRRVLMARTQHYIYYRVDERANRIEILAVWSTSRGDVPRITAGS